MRYISWFDHHLTAWIQRLPSQFNKPMIAASFIGLPGTVIVVGILFTVLALGVGEPRFAISTAAAIVAFGSLGLLKRVLRRVRPDTDYVKKYQLVDFSFPSGHSSGSFIIYGLLAHLANSHLISPWSAVAALILSFTAFLVGVSRVYLGAHYPTDVLGAWGLSALYLVLIIRVFNV